MLKQFYTLLLVATAVTMQAQEISLPEVINEGARASGWRLQHTIGYTASNMQWVRADSMHYLYPNATIGDDNGSFASDVYTHAWNVPQQLYANNIHLIKTYNAQQKITSNTNLKWDGTQWLNNTKYEYTYDGSGNNTQYSYYTWFASNWQELQRQTYAYNAQGYIMNSVYFDTTGGGTLANRSKTTNTRDGSNRVTEYINQQWVNGAWENSDKNNFYYTGSSTKEDSSFQYSWASGAWPAYPNSKTYNTYGLGGYLTQRLRKTYFNNVYSDYDKSTYLYDVNGNTTESSDFIWEVNSWQNYSKRSTTFSATNLRLETINQSYNWTSMQLENQSRYLYTYNANDLLEQFQANTWANNAWDFSGRRDYFYEQLQGNGIENVAEANIAKAFPNPFTLNTVIQFNIIEAGTTQLSITDLSGRNVYSQTIFTPASSNSILWNAKDANGNALPSGVYIVQIKAKDVTAFSKVVKQ